MPQRTSRRFGGRSGPVGRCVFRRLPATLFRSAIQRSTAAVLADLCVLCSRSAVSVLMFVLDQSRMIWNFDVALVPGVFVGSLAGRALFREFKLEGFRDGQSMRRYIVGAVLMGFGGKLAGGCAVGAGVSGGAIFAFTAWVTLACIWVAAGVTDLLLDRDVDAPVGAASGGAY
ncbi:MAG: YeeE/YedE thiosulfate transporter family protein [Rhodoplanes sp.]